MEHLNAIPCFLAVVEQQSFSEAARKLGLSKSAVSKRVNQLESALGVRLLQRTTRKISLTEAGEHYYQHACKAIYWARQADDIATSLQSSPAGKLKINVPMSFGRIRVAPLIPDFLHQYPGIEIDMVMDDKHVDLIEAGFDLAIRAGDLSDSTLIARKLTTSRSILCASPAYLRDRQHPVNPADLLDHNAISYSYSSEATEWTFCDETGCETVIVGGNYRVNNSEALLEAVLKNLGIGRLPDFVAQNYLQSGHLVQLLPQYQMPEKTIYAVLPGRTYMPARVRVFLDFLLETF